MKRWQESWDRSQKGRFYYQIQSSVSPQIKCSDPIRRKETVLSRLRFGKCYLSDTAFMLGKKQINMCDKCQVKEDVSHFLLNCNKYTDEIVERNSIILESNRLISIPALLGDPHCFEAVFQYVLKTGQNI